MVPIDSKHAARANESLGVCADAPQQQLSPACNLLQLCCCNVDITTPELEQPQCAKQLPYAADLPGARQRQGLAAPATPSPKDIETRYSSVEGR